MQFKNLKLFRPVNDIMIPPAGVDGKHVCLAFMAENHRFLDAFRFMRIKQSQVRNVFVPTTMKPRTYLTPQYRKLLLGHKLRPIKGMFGVYDEMIGKNFYLDLSNIINYSIKKFRLKKFSTGRASMMVGNIINTLIGVPEDSFHRVLVYSVNLDGAINPNIRMRKIFPAYMQLFEASRTEGFPPFDKFLLFFYDHSGGRFILLYDKEQPIKITRIRNILLKLETTDEDELEREEKDQIADEVITKTYGIDEVSDENKKEIGDAVRNFISSDPSLVNAKVDTIDPNELATAAIAYHITGDVDKAKTIAKNIKGKEETTRKVETRKLIRTFSDNLIPRPKAVSVAKDPIVKMAKPENLVDHQVPYHILEKRKKDFSELLKKDLIDTFKPLEKEELFLKVKKVNIKPIKDSVSELKQTLKDRYIVELEDDLGRAHKVEIDLPHLTDDGTFLINGQPKVLVNQLIAYPIFFFKPYHGRFETSYATINVSSKRLKKTSYLQMYLSGYKLPIISFFGYKIGFDETMKMFKIKYEVHDEKREGALRLSDGKYVSFMTDDPTGKEVVESFKFAMASFPKGSIVLNDINFWRNVIINDVGTRNCIYPIDQVWKYIVTPISAEVLRSKGDPTTLNGILKYICDEVVKGTVDDRNSLDKQRIRTSEVFTHQIQKQIIAAYNEYLSKRLGGDDTARISISPTKAFSDVTNSQNVQQLESITPLEELSMMTRITPVGIGGIPDKRALPSKAMNTHYTYYGNIDPLETPDGPMVGIQQHLTVGAAIANARGTFTIKDRSMTKPTELVSVGPAMVPFVESNDGCRVIMGTGQSKQAIPLVDPEPPAVQSGYESILTPLLSDNFIKKCPVDGTVVSVDPDLIIIKDDKTGKKIPIDTKSRVIKSGAGKHGLSVFKTELEAGEKVKKGDILAEGANIKDGIISNGRNLLTAYMSWKGYNFEDGVVISESTASKYVSIHTVEEKIYLEEDDDVIFIANVGDEIKKGGILLTYAKAVYDVETYRHLRSDGGIISSIEVYVNTENVPENLKSVYDSFKKYFVAMNGSYPQGTFKEKGEKIEGILVKFTMKQHLVLGKGDKMNNRHGNKGVVAIVEKDENMPVTPWGERVDLVLNTLGVPGRMNTGQICELHTGLIAKNLANKAIELPRNRFTSLYQRVLILLDGTDNKEYSKATIQKIKSMSDNQYKKLIGQIKTRGFIPIIAVPFKSPTRENILNALTILGLKPRYPLKLKEFNITTDPVAIGYIYMQKLEHMSAKKIASRGIGPYVSTTLAPTAGRKHGGGQKMGENDLYGLLSWDTPILIDELFGPLSSDHVTKNEMVSEIIQNGKTEFKQYKTNPVKDRLAAYMLASHLESE